MNAALAIMGVVTVASVGGLVYAVRSLGATVGTLGRLVKSRDPLEAAQAEVLAAKARQRVRPPVVRRIDIDDDPLDLLRSP